MSTHDHNPNRRPKGKDGGQYTFKTNPESTVDLRIVEDGADYAARYARHLARRYGLATGRHQLHGYMDDDDLSQEAVVAFLIASQTEKGQEDIESLPIKVIAKRSILRALDNGRERENAAYRRFAVERYARESEMGRTMRPSEVDELAEKVRLSIDENRRPAPGYHNPANRSTAVHDFSLRETANSRAPEVSSDDFPVGSVGDVAWELAESGERQRSKGLAWDAIATSTGAPLVTRGSLPKRAASKARASIQESGGALDAARAYLDRGECDPALFAPFGDTDDDARYAIASTFEKFPDYADELWGAAARAAEGRSIS